MTWLEKHSASRSLPWKLALLASILATPSLFVGFQLDDYWHRMMFRGFPGYPGLYTTFWDQFTFANGDTERTQRFMDYGFFPWWHALDSCTQPWRPIGVLTHWADFLLWFDHPFYMHVQSLAWFAAMVAAGAVLYRRIHGATLVAALAALMFALDDAHGWAVGWLANRNAVLSALFGILALIAHDAWRREGSSRAAFLAPILLAIAMLSAEASLAVVPYLLGYALFLEQPVAGSRVKAYAAQLATLSPYVAVMAVWQVLYKLLGMGSWGLDLYIDPGKEPIRFLDAAAERLPFLLLGQWGLPPSDLYASMSIRAVHWMSVAASLVLIALATAVVPVVWRDKKSRFWALGMFGSAIPVCSTLPQDRLLFFVGLGAFGLISQFLVHMFAGSKVPTLSVTRGGVWKIRKAVAWLLLIIHLPIAAVAMPIRSYSPVVMDQVVQTIRTAEKEWSFEDKTVVLVNPPSHFYAMYFPVILSNDGIAGPKRVRTLAPNPEAFSFKSPPMAVLRKDERTLAVKPAGGYEPRPVLRSMAKPFHQGDAVHLEGVTIEIPALLPEGNPGEAVFQFDTPLEDPSYLFLQCQEGALVPFHLPAVGTTVSLP
ncbi:MAG: hypothetical protein K1Y02_22730 [Candidatus Hydrogenedentes bacterium]|nr:hypothetical protein [Candidatus Hydrogenedentota bacterium]